MLNLAMFLPILAFTLHTAVGQATRIRFVDNKARASRHGETIIQHAYYNYLHCVLLLE